MRNLIRLLLLNVKQFIFSPSIYYKRGMNSLVDTSYPEFVEIGANFASAPGSIILAHDGSTVLHSNKIRVEKTVIKDDVFIGANAIIMPGITVGKGAIIGAGAIVTKDVDDFIVVAGNPARKISTVENYIKICKKRGVLYSVPQPLLDKIGTNIRYTDLELKEQQISVLKEYNENNR